MTSPTFLIFRLLICPAFFPPTSMSETLAPPRLSIPPSIFQQFFITSLLQYHTFYNIVSIPSPSLHLLHHHLLHHLFFSIIFSSPSSFLLHHLFFSTLSLLNHYLLSISICFPSLSKSPSSSHLHLFYLNLPILSPSLSFLHLHLYLFSISISISISNLSQFLTNHHLYSSSLALSTTISNSLGKSITTLSNLVAATAQPPPLHPSGFLPFKPILPTISHPSLPSALVGSCLGHAMQLLNHHRNHKLPFLLHPILIRAHFFQSRDSSATTRTSRFLFTSFASLHLFLYGAAVAFSHLLIRFFLLHSVLSHPSYFSSTYQLLPTYYKYCILPSRLFSAISSLLPPPSCLLLTSSLSRV
ncbi:hypothetical protein F4778DRAFT_530656 [Xylariomycetidae sp. FL2044]|nr:hypothetical protein F4778DRAFT_530656 [Xylariomycetidae sp. FL2044]